MIYLSKNKYHNKRIIVNGESFDSKKEAQRWATLKILEKSGKITDLKRQVSFELIPCQKQEGKIIERSCSYKADFTYEEDGRPIVEDAKGFKTPEYKIKKKLMLERYGIIIKEV